MKLRSKGLTVTGVLAIAIAGAVAASAAGIVYKVQTAPYNPSNRAITVASKWVDGAGEPGGGNNKGVLLALSYTAPFPPGVSADATVNKMCTATDATTHACTAGTSLTSLGYDRLVSGYCSSGPRWSIETLGGETYTINCNSGTHTPQTGFQDGWERVTFSDADWVGPGTCNFTNNGSVTPACQVTFLQLLLDEGPAIALFDNFYVNGQVIGKD